MALEHRAEGSSLPYRLRTFVWDLMLPLSDDVEPTATSTETHPATRSLSTARGQATHAVIEYALWCHRHTEMDLGRSKAREQGFGLVPEVLAVLEKHLDPAVDPDPAIRSVYGRWFPWLVLLDRTWASKHVSSIFSNDDAGLGDVAWDCYLSLCAPFDEVLPLLENQYYEAVQLLTEGVHPKVATLQNHGDRLAEHLMTFFWRGVLPAHDPRGLLTSFWTMAPESVRGHAIDVIGRYLHRTQEAIPATSLFRITELWDARMSAFGDAGAATTEMEGFGWWFLSPHLDDNWALERLKALLTLHPVIEPAHLVVQKLTVQILRAPVIVLECLQLLIKSDTAGRFIHSALEPLQQALGTALSLPDHDSRRMAESLVHTLGRKGYFGFRGLLSTERSES